MIRIILGLSFFLPGVFLFKLLFSSKKSVEIRFLFLLPFFSLAITSSFWFFLSLIHPQSLAFDKLWPKLAILNIILFFVSRNQAFPKIQINSKKELISSLLISFLVFLLILSPYLKTHQGSFWSTYHFGFAGARDIEKHLGLINQIKDSGLPPLNPFISNEPLNYYYFYHLNAALLGSLTKIPAELSHFSLSVVIAWAAVFTASIFFKSKIVWLLFLGYGFDFFPMIFALLKIHPYPAGLDHLDQWTIPFAQDLKVNPFSVWFTWVPQHFLALFSFLILFGIFFEKIKVNPKYKGLILSLILFSILGTSFYIFLGTTVIFFIFGVYESVNRQRVNLKKFQFFFYPLPFSLVFLWPMLNRIQNSTLAAYPFWQLPRDHLLNWQFPQFPETVLIFLLLFFLLIRFMVYFFDLGIIFCLSVLSWKKVPRNSEYLFVKITFLSSLLISVLLKSVPFNNDLCYRVSGFSWLACGLIAGKKLESFWKKLKKNKALLGVVLIIIFFPTLIEQTVLPYQKNLQDLWQLKSFIEQNLSPQAIIQAPVDFSPSSYYLLNRQTVYSPSGLIFFPDPKKTELIKRDVDALFQPNQVNLSSLADLYQIDYLLSDKKLDPTFLPNPFLEKIFENQSYLLIRINRIYLSKQSL